MLISPRQETNSIADCIRTRPITREKAYEIVERHTDSVYLVSEEIHSIQFPGWEPVVAAPELAIAMEIIPLGAPILSFYDMEQVENDIGYFQELGARLLNTGIEDAPSPFDFESVPDVVVINAAQDMRLQYEWTKGVPKHVADWINLRFYALNILNCCYIGRGAPTGVNLKEQADMMSQNLELLGRFVDAITSSSRALPEFDNTRLPEWQEKILWDARINSHFQKALKQSENFREYFHFPPLVYQFPELAVADDEFKNIRELMRQMIYAYERGEENNIPDIIWTETGPNQMSDALDEMGIVSSIDAYLCGVPFEDIMS